MKQLTGAEVMLHENDSDGVKEAFSSFYRND